MSSESLKKTLTDLIPNIGTMNDACDAIISTIQDSTPEFSKKLAERKKKNEDKEKYNKSLYGKYRNLLKSAPEAAARLTGSIVVGSTVGAVELAGRTVAEPFNIGADLTASKGTPKRSMIGSMFSSRSKKGGGSKQTNKRKYRKHKNTKKQKHKKNKKI